jgi:UDP-GlcNAc:undecaprenyl-phosphate GlcNAc-1-phosphate transferase
MHIFEYLIAGLLGFGLTVLMVPFIKFVATHLNIVDKPDESRKTHKAPTPLLGGIGIYLAVTIGIFIIYYAGLADFSRIPLSILLAVNFGGLLLMIGGALDDIYRLKPWQQIIWPVCAALLVVASGVQVAYVTDPFGGLSKSVLYITPMIGSIVAFGWLMGMMYTTKFLDGLDGLVSGIAVIASLFVFIASLAWDVDGSATGVWALLVASACLGFLIFNWHPAKIFLGEGGSLYIGFILGVLSIISGSKIMTTLLVVGIPVLDVLFVIIGRLWRKQSPFSHADRTHLHFQLLDRGHSQRQVVLLLYMIALVFGTVSTITNSMGKIIGFALLIVLMIVLLAPWRNLKKV